MMTHLDLQKRFPTYHVCPKCMAALLCCAALRKNVSTSLQVLDEVGNDTGRLVTCSRSCSRLQSTNFQVQEEHLSHNACADDVTLCNRRDYARSGIVDVSGMGLVVGGSHRAVPRNHECCHWRPRHAVSPSNHVQSTIINFHFLSQFSSRCLTVSIHHHFFPVAILCTLLHRENTSFEVWYLHIPSVTVDRRLLYTIHL